MRRPGDPTCVRAGDQPYTLLRAECARYPELYLLALRAGVAGLARSFPAFDTCLALYSARQHPGMSMVESYATSTAPSGSGASRSVSPSTSTATTVIPAEPSRRATARPMPCAAPVTIAIPEPPDRGRQD